jgi:outer membrane protein TolC
MLEPVPPAAKVITDWRQALRIVRGRSTEVAIAQSRIEEARANSRSVLARSLPTITGTGTVNRHLITGTGPRLSNQGIDPRATIPDPRQIWNGTISVNQPLLDMKAWYDHGSASQRERISQLSARDTERLVLAALADALVNVFTSERLAEVSRISLRSSLSTSDLTRRRARLGAAAALDVLRTEQEVTRSRAQVVQADENLRQSREALGMALGYPEPWGVNPEVKLDQLAADARHVCQPVQAVDTRADVLAAQANVDAAQRAETSADYTLLPTLDLLSDFTVTSSPFTANGKEYQWTVGAMLTIPFYDGGARYGARRQAEAQSETARHQLEQARRQATLEVTQSQRQVGVALANLQVSQQSRDVAGESARLAQVAFVNGSGTSFDLVDAARQLREAEVDLAIKEFEVVRAQVTALLAAANCQITD